VIDHLAIGRGAKRSRFDVRPAVDVSSPLE
jgi:hypothetical protein